MLSLRSPLTVAVAVAAIAVASSGCAPLACDDPAQGTKGCDPGDTTSATTGYASSAANTSAGTATGSSGTGVGGGLSEWTAPPCDSVMGTAAATFSLDEGVTTAPSQSTPLSGISYTFGIAALDTPGFVLVDHAGELLLSRDAGCHFESLGETGLTSASLTAAPNGTAYGWIDNDSGLYRFEAAPSDPKGGVLTLLTSPSPHLIGLGIDPSRPFHVRVMNAAGQIFESKDRGEHFDPIGLPCPAQGGLIYRGAFDPSDLDHVVCGVSTIGVAVSSDGGGTWTVAEGLGDKANAFSAAVSPVNGAIVWAEGITLAPVEGRHVFRSEDGGLHFAPVIDEGSGVTLTNGAPLWPHPKSKDRLLFEFGTDFQGYGTDIYVYDYGLGTVTTHHHDFDQVAALAYSPFDATILYLGVSSEQIQQ
ncbi:MAG: sialidase family protein [Polyangiaceae bacterium]